MSGEAQTRTTSAGANLEQARRVLRALEPRISPILVALALIATSVWAFRASENMGEYSDEMYHVPQIQRFCSGHYRLDGAITMLPGFHMVDALVGRALHDCSRHALRGLNVATGLLVTLIAYAILRALRSKYPLTRASAFHFLPILFPYDFVVYTDVLALAFALGAVWLMLRRRTLAAGVVGSLGVLVRQTNVVVLLFMLAVALWERDRGAPLRELARRFLRKNWTSLLGLFAFAVFVLVNRGVAIGDRSMHKPGVHIGNLSFALFLVALVSLPAGLDCVWKQRGRWLSRPFLAALLVLYLAHMTFFSATNAYNTQLNFIRNALVQWAAASQLTKMLFFAPMILGFAVLWMARLSRAALWSWYPIALVSLLPESLIEQRYAILPIALFMLARKDASPSAELLSVLSNAVLSIGLLLMISGGTWSF